MGTARPHEAIKFLKRAATGGKVEDPQLAEIAAHFFHLAGGTRAVAKMLFDEFTRCKPGSLMRQRILEMLLRVTKFANERSARVENLGQLSDEDLERELRNVVLTFPGVREEIHGDGIQGQGPAGRHQAEGPAGGAEAVPPAGGRGPGSPA